jgi:hypothetical protein
MSVSLIDAKQKYTNGTTSCFDSDKIQREPLTRLRNFIGQFRNIK